MLNYINIRDAFAGCDNSYEVVKRLKTCRENGAIHLYVHQFQRISLGRAMYIIVSMSQEGYTLSEIRHYLETLY